MMSKRYSGNPVGLKRPDICLTGEENHEKPQPENLPGRGSNLGPLRDKRACYRLHHIGGQFIYLFNYLLTYLVQLQLMSIVCRGL